MVSEAPPFWWKKRGDPRAWLLSPFAALYAAAARHRLQTAMREHVDAPVLCVGNLTVGGSGKTPVALSLARAARAMRLVPGFLTRGHGGTVGAPHLVDADHDGARHVGDEPLLLARATPTVVAADRAAGAALLIAKGCNFVIMDDGFQSARIHMDYALLVVDARRGIGNGYVVPAGPLRARVIDQLRHADGVLIMGEGEAAARVVRRAARAGRPVYEAHAEAHPPPGLAGRRCLAFAGIGDPEKFFETARGVGAELVVTRRFGDHHFYNEHDVRDLLSTAEAQDLVPVTTAKDAVRLAHGTASTKELAARSKVIEIETVFALPNTAATIVSRTLEGWHRRRIRRD